MRVAPLLHSQRIQLNVEPAGDGGGEVRDGTGDDGGEGRVTEGHGRNEERQEPLFRRGEREQT